MKAKRNPEVKPNPTTTDNPERRKRILDAALKLTLRYGFDKTTMDDIAREAGVSKGALYLHYVSKDDLFEALIWREVWEYTQDFLKAINDDPHGGTLVNMYKHGLVLLHSRTFMRALYSRDLHLLGDFLKRRDPSFFQRRQLLGKEFIQMMQDAKLVRQDLEPHSISYIFAVFSHGLTTIDQVLPPSEAPPPLELIETLMLILGKALTPDEPGVSEAGKQLINSIVEKYTTMMPEFKPDV